MSDAPQEVYTFSFRSSDATHVSPEGEFTFNLNAAAGHKKPLKVSLASMEFPMSQYSIEEGWNRIYFMERILITPNVRTLRLGAQLPAVGGEVTEVETVLPLHSNEIESLSFSLLTYKLTVKTKHPHGLFVGSRSLVPQWQSWGERCRVLAAPFGTLDVSLADEEGRLEPGGDDDEFHVRWGDATPPITAPGRGVLVCPSPPSLSHLASVVNAGLRHSALGRSAKLAYDPVDNVMEFAATVSLDENLRLLVGGDALCTRLGFGAGRNEKVISAATLDPSSAFARYMDSDAQRQLLQLTQSIDAGAERDEPVLRGGTVPWPYITLRPGWYTPSKRSYASSPPQRLGAEFELQFNRFVFKPREDGGPTITVIDDQGVLRSIELMVGRFSPDTMAVMLTQALSAAGGITCSFERTRFVFRHTEPFALVFNHPLSLDPIRLGFDQMTYDGQREYAGEEIYPPLMGWDNEVYTPSNMYGLIEEPARPQLTLVGLPPAPFIATMSGYAAGVATMTTFVGGKPAGHALRPGDVVRLCAPSAPVEIGGAPVAAFDPQGSFAVVKEVTQLNQFTCFVPAGATWAVAASVGNACTLRIPVEPSSWNFSLSMPSTITGRRLGWPNEVVQHLASGGQYRFTSPGVHDIDHPDYVLLYIKSSNRSTTNIHLSDGGATCPFAKIVLYPGFREERSLTRDMILPSGEDLSNFTVWFRNPDGTAYANGSDLHGAAWSFSLNFFMVG